jgi:hypothetical protein
VSGVDRVYLAPHGRTRAQRRRATAGIVQPAPGQRGEAEAQRLAISQRTACYNQLSRVNGRWRVDFYDCKPQG